MSKKIYPLFSVFGIELEYMIVDDKDLSVKAIADQLIQKIAGFLDNEIELGSIAISNELAMHVIELKTNGPAKSLDGLSTEFHAVIQKINETLKGFGARLMPTGAHPWLKPKDGITLWHHGDRSIYETFHRIFDCSGHGWGNLQSTHITLPFANEEEFIALHTAIRLLLPLIPALTASTPILESTYQEALDSRLLFYGTNQQTIPHISGHIIPEAIRSIDEYHQVILQPMYRDIELYDHEHLLQNEWLNSRGAIAKFEYNAIEIRIVDSQESPLMDLLCAKIIVEVLKYLMTLPQLLSSLDYPTLSLKALYDAAIYQGPDAIVSEQQLLSLLGVDLKKPCTLKQLWTALIAKISPQLNEEEQKMAVLILKQGNLAQRIIKAVGPQPEQKTLFKVYQKLCDCLRMNTAFVP